ncbi:peptidyl-prolyl cis-trans isomerase [Pyxidicoccus fallax]|uniref:PpiC domain-containing protein n=1 Tax=Pyxidicoccus fallax TaxID=394095 RepID=A0A848LGP3_9BACT|nr:peptidylprolyl isomerase [Pyxidicoccus fallax]NMO16555.1 hypothetical protein [Pyxidicoccus fallax]NPC79881.1 peptidyl-prolyl cis-trans isomerase [Pyxidicoccus fallax]
MLGWPRDLWLLNKKSLLQWRALGPAALLASTAIAAAPSELWDEPGPVAVVDGHEVSRSRFERLVNARRNSLQGRRVESGSAADKALQAAVASQLVDEALIEAAARGADIRVTEREVDSALDACSRHVGGSANLRALVDSRFSTLEELRTQLRIALLFERAAGLANAPELPEAVLREHYERTVGAFAVVEFSIEEETVAVAVTDAPEELARKQAQAAELRGRVGAQGSKARRRRVSEMDLAPELREAIAGLEEGGVTPVVRTAEGYVVAKLVKRHPPARPSFESVRGALADELRHIARRQQARGFMDTLRKEADVLNDAAARHEASVPAASDEGLASVAPQPAGAVRPSAVVAGPLAPTPSVSLLTRFDALPRQCGNWASILGEVRP